MPRDCMLGDGKSNETFQLIRFSCWDGTRTKGHLLEGSSDFGSIGDVRGARGLRSSLNGGRVLDGCSRFVGSVRASIAGHR